MRRIHFLLVIAAVLLVGAPCHAQQISGTVHRGNQVYGVRDADAALNAAMDQARATLPVFNGYLARTAEGDVEAMIKAGFRQGDRTEHMWVSDVTFDGRVYRGRLVNRPMDLTNVRQDEAVAVVPEHVSDWMVVLDGVGLGNFTTLEFRRRMSPAERSRFDRSRHYRILADTALLALPQP